MFNPLNAKLNPICHLLALLVGHHILHVSRISVKGLNEYPLVLSTFCTILGEFGMGDLHLLSLSSCDFFANWISATHTLLKDI
jgi:hypothetical protein